LITHNSSRSANVNKILTSASLISSRSNTAAHH